ncbi:MAG: winged helix-turn-helix domain-containing protein [Pseudomonadota bacterium]|nr:winged helix-turn-helix domain-containing protein [Pseudomonadota bacterium]
MATDQQVAYEFGQFTLVPTEKRLLCDGKVVPLTPKVFDTLVLLVKNQGRLIEKEELLRTLWPRTVVEEVALAHSVSQLRKALGDPAEDPQFIETVPKRGYRFIAAVRERGEPQAASPASGGEAPSAVRHAPPLSRPAMLGVFAAVLAASTAAYFYLSATGKKVAGVLPAIHSLAVLPFENLSGDKEQEYFADGMTDELITELGRIGALRVVSRTSAMQYKGTRKPLSDIAGELKVDAVVEGTVLRSGNRVRISAQLIEAIGDRHLWAQSYERDLNDILALQGNVSRDIAEIIRIKLTPQQRTMLTAVRAVDPEAHDLYLRGRYWSGGYVVERFNSSDNLRKGLDYFQKAIAKDPNYALAYAGIADCFQSEAGGDIPVKEAFAKAEDAARKALQLDPSLAEAHASLAGIKLYDWDWSGAEREFKEALALNPNYATAHLGYSYYLSLMGRLDEAVKEAERARDLDPVSIPTNVALGFTLYNARRYDDALRQWRRGLDMFPEMGMWNWGIGFVYEQRKMFAEAYAQIHQSISLNKETQRVAAIEQAYKRSGYRGAEQLMIQWGEQTQKTGDLLNLNLLHHYAMLDDDAHVMLCLERAFEERDPNLPIVLVDPALDHLRGSPRFSDLIRRMGLPPSVDSVPVGNLPDQPVGAR